MIQSAAYNTAWSMVAEAGRWLKLGLETTAATLIAYGAALTISRLLRRVVNASVTSFVEDRLLLGRYLTWALDFQLAGDILDTAIAPTWKEIGEVAAIAAIRTALNYVLTHEMRDEQRRLDRMASETVAAPTSNGGSSARG